MIWTVRTGWMYEEEERGAGGMGPWGRYNAVQELRWAGDVAAAAALLRAPARGTATFNRVEIK